MRRGLGLPCLALVRAAGLAEPGTATASDPVSPGAAIHPPVPEMPVPNASLVRIDTNSGNVAGNVALEPTAPIVAPPPLVMGSSPDLSMTDIGSEEGVLYAVEAPF